MSKRVHRIGDAVVAAAMFSTMTMKFLNLAVVKELNLPVMVTLSVVFVAIATLTIAFIKPVD